LYRQSDNHLIYPVFQVSDKIRQSPLLVIRILALLDDTRKGARNVEDGHLSVQSIVDYFSAIGHSEIGIESALIPMLQAGLVEAYDPSVQDLLPSQRLATTSRARCAWVESERGFPNQRDFDSTCWLGRRPAGDGKALFTRLA
jgi:hypothetical protein